MPDDASHSENTGKANANERWTTRDLAYVHALAAFDASATEEAERVRGGRRRERTRRRRGDTSEATAEATPKSRFFEETEDFS